MKPGGIRSALYVILFTGLSPCASQALDVYLNNVDADLPGPGITPNGVWAWTAGILRVGR
jgi:hypothetical protein